MKALNIAIIGTRGIPARYGGFETFAEELSIRLASRGHKLTVYSRCKWQEKKQPFEFAPNIRVIPLRAVAHKYLETIQHTASSLWHARKQAFDCILVCNAANSPLLPLLWGTKMPVVVNVDGIERHRSKWNSFGKLWYRLGECCSVYFAKRQVADAEVIADYYREVFSAKPDVIAYGAKAQFEPAGETLKTFNLIPKNYILYVTRFEPENNVLGVIQGYRSLCEQTGGMPPLVLVGDAPYASEYKKALHQAAEGLNVIFTGFQFERAYRELRSHARIAVQATEVGGTHPALIEAMAYGNPIIANRVPEHEEVLADTGLFYEKNNFIDLGGQLKILLADAELQTKLSEAATARVSSVYTWERVSDQYEKLFFEMVEKK